MPGTMRAPSAIFDAPAYEAPANGLVLGLAGLGTLGTRGRGTRGSGVDLTRGSDYGNGVDYGVDFGVVDYGVDYAMDYGRSNGTMGRGPRGSLVGGDRYRTIVGYGREP